MKRSSRISFKPRSIRRLEKRTRRNLAITIVISIILVLIIVNWGLPTFIGGLSVFNKLKPFVSQKSVSEDTSPAPPKINIPYEATSSAEIKIFGYSLPNSKVEIYLDDELKNTSNTREDGSFTSGSISLSLGTNNIYGKTVDEKNKQSLSSKTIKLIYSNEKPKLEVNEPQDGQQVKDGDKKIRVLGKTDQNTTLTINGSTVILSNEGSFSSEVQLNDGDNTISIVATNNVGNSVKIDRKVNYSP